MCPGYCQEVINTTFKMTKSCSYFGRFSTDITLLLTTQHICTFTALGKHFLCQRFAFLLDLM